MSRVNLLKHSDALKILEIYVQAYALNFTRPTLAPTQYFDRLARNSVLTCGVDIGSPGYQAGLYHCVHRSKQCLGQNNNKRCQLNLAMA